MAIKTPPTCTGGGGTFGSVIDLSEMQTIADATILGNNTGGASIPVALTAAQVRTLLSLVVGTHVQAYDADLTTYAGITPSANVQSVLGAADYSAIRTLLGLVIGTNVQAWDTQLDSLAGLSYSGNGSKVLRVNAGETAFELATPSSGGKLLQEVATSTGAVATGTTTVPLDDTIMQNTEGTEFITLAITPTAADSTLEIDVLANLSMNSGGGGYTIGCGLFVDTTADALQCVSKLYQTGAETDSVLLRHRVAAGSTSSRTYKFRAGPSAAATITLNGTASARKFGGVMGSWMTIREIGA